MSPVGIALVGAGAWGATLARALSRVPGAELRWICDIDQARRTEMLAAHPGAKVTEALDEVLGDPAVQAAVVAVESARHYGVGMRVLVANRHLLVEKPMALSVAEAARLRDAAAERDRVLTVGHLLLHHPAIRTARALLASGALGEPLYLESVRTTGTSGRRAGSAWWTLAPHDISLALYLFDAIPARVTAVRNPGAGDQDAVVFATLHFPNGKLAHIHTARFSADRERRFSIVGTTRSLVFDELAPERGLRLGGTSDTRPSFDEAIAVPAGDALLAQCSHFVTCVANGDPTAGNSTHALGVVRVLEAGARSMREDGAPVEVS